LSQAGRESYYAAEGMQFIGGAGRWIVRASRDAARLEPEVRAAVKSIDPMALVREVRPMEAAMDKARAPTRFALVLAGIFAAIAALLGAVGLYGVLSSVVRERTPEIGVRMALGAAQGGIFGLVIRQGAKLAAIGLGIGLLSAFGLTRAMRTLLVGVSP